MKRIGAVLFCDTLYREETLRKACRLRRIRRGVQSICDSAVSCAAGVTDENRILLFTYDKRK